MWNDDHLLDLLDRHFGFRSFRPGQEEVVRSVLEGRPTLAVMPTGAGKSLCYQLPALALPGLTLVVSPLVALMRDQVDALRRRGIEAAYVNSSQTEADREQAEQRMADGRLKLVYAAPERFRSASFLRALNATKLSLMAVDEAHCVSEWGYAFRPDYELLGEAIRGLKPARLLAVTATAAPDVRADIVRALRMADARVHVAGFDRPNLHLEVHKLNTEAEKLDTLAAAVGVHSPAIVYTATRRQADRVAAVLNSRGISAGAYHAGLDTRARETIQDDFQSRRLAVVTATNAFGLGIDKADVRIVLHSELPRSLEAYYQEIGRAGRDGLPAIAALLFAPRDIFLQKRLLQLSTPRPELVRALWAALVAAKGPLTREQLDRVRSARQARSDVFASLAFLESAGLVQRLSRPGDVAVQMRPGIDLAGESVAGAVARQVARHGTRAQAAELARGLGCKTPRELKQLLDRLSLEGALRYSMGKPRAAYLATPGRALSNDHLHRLRMRSSRDQGRLEHMIQLAKDNSCRRRGMLAALGDPATAISCSGCDVCSGHRLRVVRSRLESPPAGADPGAWTGSQASC